MVGRAYRGRVLALAFVFATSACAVLAGLDGYTIRDEPSIDASVIDTGAIDGGARVLVDRVVPDQSVPEASQPDTATLTYSEAVLAKGPLVYYRFEELTGTVAADESPNGRDGAYSAVVLGGLSARPGLGSAAGFRTTKASLVKVPAIGTFAQVSIECFVRPITYQDADANGFNVIYNVDNYGPNALHYQMRTSPVGLQLTVNASSPVDVRDVRPPLGQWSFLVTTYDGASGKVVFYINGIASKTGALGGGSAALTNAQIGSWGGARFFDGEIDELAIYGEVLTAAEVMDHWARAQ